MAKRKPELSPQILEEASSWFIDFNENAVDAAGRDEFNAWLRRSPEHVRAYLQMSAFWEDADILDKRPDLDIEALIARAQKEQNVYPLELGFGVVPEGAVFRTSAPSPVPRPVLALAAALLLSVGAFAAWSSLYRGVYATDIGEQRSIALEDGSSLELNSRSRVKVHFTDRERRIELLEGQALFRVEKNAHRPFTVRIGQTVVRAVGTAFDVNKRSAGTVVTVVEGRVAITPEAGGRRSDMPPGSTYLSAGEQLTVEATAKRGAAARPKLANVSKATAWTEKKLMFESTPLREVVEEFNRYNRQQLVIRDPELYDFHVTGVFPSTDSRRMIGFLRQRFRVTMKPSDEEVEISKAQ